MPEEMILPTGVPQEGRTLIRPGFDPFSLHYVLDLPVTLLSKSLRHTVVHRHTYISLRGGQGIFLGAPVFLQMFRCCSGILQLLRPAQMILFATCLSSRNPLLKKWFICIFSLDNQVPLPGIPDHCMALVCTCLTKGRDRVAALARENYIYWGCKMDELVNIFKGYFTHNCF